MITIQAWGEARKDLTNADIISIVKAGIVKVTSPLNLSITHGHLCIKGRFGIEFVQNREEGTG
jgi:Molybdopterin oxidoreductase Fe4S4 domain